MNTSLISKIANAARSPWFSATSKDTDELSEHRTRVSGYQCNWDEYDGTSLKKMRGEDGVEYNPINLLKKMIDKVNYFSFGKGFTLINDDYAEALKVAQDSWGSRLIEKITRIGQYGAVGGDAYVMVVPVTVGEAKTKVVDVEGKPTLVSDSDTAMSVVCIDHKFCTPVYDSFDVDKLISISIDVPQRIFDDNGKWSTQYEHLTITDTLVYTELRDMHGRTLEGSQKTEENAIGHIYVHHIRNYPNGRSIYGSGDVEDIAPLNKEISKEINSLGRIIDYHGDPITLIYGARASNLSKGKNKIWGGLPKDARVENLTLDSDLTAATNNIDRLKEMLFSLVGVPEIAQGTHQAISNTSGVALSTMYMPLIQQADTKHTQYSPHLIEIAITCLRWIRDLKITLDTEELTKAVHALTETDFNLIRTKTIVKFPSPLPKDELIQAQIQTTLIAAKLQTREAALAALGQANPRKRIEEVDEELKKMAEEGIPLEDKTPSKIESGFSPDTGVNKTDSDEQKGRPNG